MRFSERTAVISINNITTWNMYFVTVQSHITPPYNELSTDCIVVLHVTTVTEYVLIIGFGSNSCTTILLY